MDVLRCQKKGSRGGLLLMTQHPLQTHPLPTHRAEGWMGAWVGVMADLGKGGL